MLSTYFQNVQRFDYKDSLAVTNTHDLIDWIKSAIMASQYSETEFNDLYDYFENIRQKEGAINIPKEVGLFVNE